MFEHVFDRTELAQESDRRFFSDSFASGDIIAGIAHQSKQVDDLSLMFDIVFLAHLLGTHEFKSACVPRAIHEDAIRDKLSVVLVRSSHIDFKTGLFALFGECTDNIIGFKARHFKHRDIHGHEEVFDNRNGFADVLRRFRPLGFILLVRLMTEGTPGRVKRHTDMSRVDLLDEVFQRYGKAENSGSVLSFTIHPRRFDKSVVCAKNHRVSINKK